MKKSTKILSLILAAVLILTLAACGGGGGDALKGKWSGPDDTYGTVTWDFDGKGGCNMETDFYSGKGTYTIEEEKVSIKLEAWTNPIEYEFKIEDDKLDLKAVTELAPGYAGLTKK